MRAERLRDRAGAARSAASGRERACAAADAEPARQRSHLCARVRGNLRLMPVDDVHYLQAEDKYVIVHHARGEDLIEESLKTLEDEFDDRFVRIHRNCLVASDEFLSELDAARRTATCRRVLRHGKTPLEVSRRTCAAVRELAAHL